MAIHHQGSSDDNGWMGKEDLRQNFIRTAFPQQIQWVGDVVFGNVA